MIAQTQACNKTTALVLFTQTAFHNSNACANRGVCKPNARLLMEVVWSLMPKQAFFFKVGSIW
jgi:hypothetical protein